MVPRKKTYISTVHMKRRLNLAIKYVNMPLTYWKKILWFDESKFNLRGSDGAHKVWKMKDEA